jgi:hypothetical protein
MSDMKLSMLKLHGLLFYGGACIAVPFFLDVIKVTKLNMQTQCVRINTLQVSQIYNGRILIPLEFMCSTI